ncbi:molybdopterin-dependent oxidoreductase [Actinopolymorpha alba]|uniref:molybdopterin-dependent oxidoreductase n=1 Tax=Actinopolymorpha alba TaxID=533267 RepID=UPI00036F21AA
MDFVQSRRGESDVSTSGPSHIDARHGLPPGQRWATDWKVLHYGPVPRVTDPSTWELRVGGATASGQEHLLTLATLQSLPQVSVRGDLHCVSGFSVPDLAWEGIPAGALLQLVPPREDVSWVLACAQYGYSANLTLADFRSEGTLLATRVGGQPLPPERGGPLRLVAPHLFAWKGPKWLRSIEYLTEERRGFWEERGYHNTGDPWSGQRYSYQEDG